MANNDYSKYLNHLDGVNKEIFSDIMPIKVFYQYNEMIELLKKYNECVGNLNAYISIESGVFNDINKAKGSREEVRHLIDKEIIKEIIEAEILEQKVSALKGEIAKASAEIDYTNLEAVDNLSKMVENFKSCSGDLARKKIRLERVGKVGKQMLDEATENYGGEFDNYVTTENKVVGIQNEINDVVTQMKYKALFLEDFKTPDGNQRINGVNVKPKHEEAMFNEIKKSKIGIFYGISPEIRDDVIKQYINLFKSYVSLKKAIMSRALPIAEGVIENYDKRPIELEKDDNVNIFKYDAEAQLRAVVCDIRNLKNLSNENQKLEAKRIEYNVQLIVVHNALCVNIINGVELDNSVSKLSELQKEAYGNDPSKASMFAAATSNQDFSIYSLGYRQVEAMKETTTAKRV